MILSKRRQWGAAARQQIKPMWLRTTIQVQALKFNNYLMFTLYFILFFYSPSSKKSEENFDFF